MSKAATIYDKNLKKVNITPRMELSFLRKVNHDGPIPRHAPHLGPCAVWTGEKDKDGYGKMYVSNRHGKYMAHRFSWIMNFGEIPEGMFVLHECDNASCVKHLFLGTQMDNMQDKNKKGRGVYTGPKNPPRETHWSKREEYREVKNKASEKISKLTQQQVCEIRQRASNGETQTSLAKEFGVSQSTISNTILRVTWGHIT